MDEARETDRRATDRTDAAARAARDTSGLSGRQVSHFRILEPLGAGGMGVVYRAEEDLQLHRTVALEFMRPDYTIDARGRVEDPDALHQGQSNVCIAAVGAAQPCASQADGVSGRLGSGSHSAALARWAIGVRFGNHHSNAARRSNDDFRT